MTTTEQQQDHPGDDWVEIIGREGYHTRFFHPGLHHVVIWKEDKDGASRAAAVAECRAISAAALAWEQKKAGAGFPFSVPQWPYYPCPPVTRIECKA